MAQKRFNGSETTDTTKPWEVCEREEENKMDEKKEKRKQKNKVKLEETLKKKGGNKEHGKGEQGNEEQT